MRHYLAIALCMLVWSTWGPLIRWMALPTSAVLFYTALIAGIALPVVLRIRGELELSVPRSYWWMFASLAAASVANNLTYFYALGATTVSNAVFAHYIAPIVVAVLAPLLIAEPIQRVTMLSLPLAASGMVLIIGASGGLHLEDGHAAGIAAGAFSGVAYAFLIVISRRLSQLMMHRKAVVILIWLTAVVTAPFALTADHELTVRSAGLLLVAGLVHSTVATLVYYNALRHVIAQHAAILGYLEPLAAVPLAYLFLSETPSAWSLAGGGLILLSGYLVVRAGSGRQRAGA